MSYTEDEYRQFKKLVEAAESFDQLQRIEARLRQPKFIELHGKEKCDIMFDRLCKEEP